MLIADGLSCTLDGRDLLSDVNVRLESGEILAILGPNGAGKSTLLKLLAREMTPTRGRVELNGRDLAQWSALALARQRAVLPQSESLRFPFDVRQVVSLGRYPWSAVSTDVERRIVAEAMEATGVSHFADRIYTTLSVGERARVQLARVLAQIWESAVGQTRYLLLDEPTASLDLAHQHEVLAAVRRFAARGAGVAMVLHDLNLALQYADRVLLMKGGRIEVAGPVHEALNANDIERVFDVDVDFVRRSDADGFWIAPRPHRRREHPGRVPGSPDLGAPGVVAGAPGVVAKK